MGSGAFRRRFKVMRDSVGVQRFRFRVPGSGFRVSGFGFEVVSLGLKVQSLGSGVYGSVLEWFRVWVWGFGIEYCGVRSGMVWR